MERERLFYLLRNERASPAPPPALPVCPSGGDPSPQRTRTDCTRQAAAQAVPDARQTMPRHAQTLDTLHRSALDARQAVPGRSGRRRGWRSCSVSGKVYNFGLLFLSIFIWIYFAESIDNPYIYGYNIISPDKYGLQPH